MALLASMEKYLNPSKIDSGVKQGCIMAPTLFVIFFSLMLTYAFGITSDGTHLHTRHNGKLINLKRLRAKTKITCVLIRLMLLVMMLHWSATHKKAFSTSWTDFRKHVKNFHSPKYKENWSQGTGCRNPTFNVYWWFQPLCSWQFQILWIKHF